MIPRFVMSAAFWRAWLCVLLGSAGCTGASTAGDAGAPAEAGDGSTAVPVAEAAHPTVDPLAEEDGETSTDDSESSSSGTGSGGLPPGGPCPPSIPCRILPMGDSITFGMRATPDGSTSSGGYRRYLRRALLDAGKSFEYVGGCPGFGGRCRIPPGGDPPYCFAGGAPELGRHDGHPGWDINAFRAREGGSCPGSVFTFLTRVTDDAGSHVVPHVVLLMVGGNDVRAGAGIREGAALRFRYLLDEMLAVLPGSTRIIVGTVTPNLNGTNNRDGVIPFNRAITTVVRARRDAGHDVRMVNTYGAIHIDSSGGSPDLSADLLHPNEQGYRKIAARWLEAVGPLVHPR